MSFYNRSLRTRIFLSMIFLVIGTSILIAVVTIFQYKEEAKDYHQQRLLRKEKNIRKSIDYVLKTTTYPVITQKVPLIFKDKIYEIKDINGLEMYLYDLNGKLLISSEAEFIKNATPSNIPKEYLTGLKNSTEKSFVAEYKLDNKRYRSAFTYITDRQFKPLAILNIRYLEDDSFINKELSEYLYRLGIAYIFMLIAAIVMAYFLSKYITKSLKTITQKIIDTRLNQRNKRIEIGNKTSYEIGTLVEAYNQMIDELEESAAQLAASEREAAWREMAKQVAHEIKNPLTPMRLTVQSFQRRFDPNDPDINHKMEEFSNSLIQQIDTMSAIASAFSAYANMPAQKDEQLDVVKVTKLALDIFNEEYITFSADDKQIIANLDRTQLIRIITNLVKNSIQAITQQNPEKPAITVHVSQNENDIILTVSDNGLGIADEHKSKVFEPKFTTKSSGMGLGLAMIKKIIETYKGSITFVSQEKKGTTFTVVLPKKPQ